ncbi:MAG: hypothetical protein ACP5KA_06935 [Desulfurococcaceae archaeon]
MGAIKKAAGILLTVIALATILAGFAIGGGRVSGDMALAVALMGFAVLLVGPWLWFGDVPVAVRKFVEARTGRKLEGEAK